MNFIPLLQAGAAQGGSSFMTIGMFAVIFVIFYLFIIRPQSKKQKETERMINSIKKGDKVITIGGMHGEVSAVREKTFVLKVEDGSKIEFSRSAISSVVNEDAGKPAKADRAGKAEKAEKAKKPAKLFAGKKEGESDESGAAQAESADNSGKNE